MNFIKIFNEVNYIYKFIDSPILIGGGAMQYYNLRNIGSDLDIVISKRDKLELLKKGYTLNLFGGKTEKDVDSTFTNFENKNIDLVITLNQYDYEFFNQVLFFIKIEKIYW